MLLISPPSVRACGGSGSSIVNELLAIIGTSWRPLLLFPGLLAALLLVVIVRFAWRPPTPAAWTLNIATSAQAASCVLVLAFLPVPGSPWRYGLDLLVTLALVEVPHWWHIRRRWGAADPKIRAGAAAEMAALLNVYVLLGLAVAAIGQASGSWVLNELRGGSTPLWWAGVVVWGLCLPPLLGSGPWTVAGANDVAFTLRRVAHVALLATLALPHSAGYGGLAVAASFAFGSLALVDRMWHGRRELWERAQPVLALLLLAALLYTGATAWYERAN